MLIECSMMLGSQAWTCGVVMHILRYVVVLFNLTFDFLTAWLRYIIPWAQLGTCRNMIWIIVMCALPDRAAKQSN